MFRENIEIGALIEVDKNVSDEQLIKSRKFFKDSVVIREGDYTSKEFLEWKKENIKFFEKFLE
jgi:hypothetical protein